MIEVKIFLITCDESQHILPVTVYLLNKYFNTKLNIVILGYTKLKYNFPNNVQYIELKQGEKRDKTRWFRDVYNYFNTIKDEYVIFSVDDVPESEIGFATLIVFEPVSEALVEIPRVLVALNGVAVWFLY